MSEAGLVADDGIPKGFQIYEHLFNPAGISFREADAAAFANSSGGWLELEPEPSNQYDKNAIKVIGCSQGLFWTKRRLVGYVPKEISRKIIKRGFLTVVRPRLMYKSIGSDGNIKIEFQILGPKERMKEYAGT